MKLPKNFYWRDSRGREIVRIRWWAIAVGALALILAALLLFGCQSAKPSAPVASATVPLKLAGDKIEIVKAEAVKTEVALKAAQDAPTLPEAKTEVSKAQVSNGAVLEAAGGAGKAVAVAAPLAAAHEKNEAVALEAASKAEEALASRARNRIEWALIIGGLACWAVAGLLIYAMASGAGVSIIRRVGVIVALGVAGAACFAAAVYFDRILLIGAWTLGIGAAVGLVAAILHYRKHKNASEEALWALGEIQKLPNMAPEDLRNRMELGLKPLEFEKLKDILPK